MRSGRRLALAAMTAMVTGAAFVAACGLDLVGTEQPGPSTDDGGPDGGRPSDAAPNGDATSRTCRSNLAGPTLVTGPGAVGCIDRTEVTNGQYDLFLAATDGGPATDMDAGLPSGCGFTTTYRRKGGAVEAGAPEEPVAQVTWCDAFAYCRWAGKRLCGGVASDRDAASGEWYAACSNGSTQPYPYGASFLQGACWENDISTSVRTVASRPTCTGGLPGVFDLGGNVREWIDSCDPATGCAAAGSYWASPASATGCRTSFDFAQTTADPALGFRCCTDAD